MWAKYLSEFYLFILIQIVLFTIHSSMCGHFAELTNPRDANRNSKFENRQLTIYDQGTNLPNKQDEPNIKNYLKLLFLASEKRSGQLVSMTFEPSQPLPIHDVVVKIFRISSFISHLTCFILCHCLISEFTFSVKVKCRCFLGQNSSNLQQ